MSSDLLASPSGTRRGCTQPHYRTTLRWSRGRWTWRRGHGHQPRDELLRTRDRRRASKILTILPIGCRTYAVKPHGSFTKSAFEYRGWSGMTGMSTSRSQPGGDTQTHKTRCTSDVMHS